MSKQIKLDWEIIESAYRVNNKSNARLARAFGIKESTLRSRAKRNSWSHSLNKCVRAASDKIDHESLGKREASHVEDIEPT